MKPSIITDQIDQDLEKALEIISKKGYQTIELHNVFSKTIEACSDEEINEIKRLIEKYNVKVSNISSTVFFLCPLYPDDQVTLFNPEFYTIEGNVETHLDYLENACKIAQKLDCPRIRVFPFRFPDNRKPYYGTAQDMALIIENVKKAVRVAENYGITLVLENCPYSHLPKGKMTLEIVKEINSPNLKLLWDPANSYRAVKNNVPDEYLDLNLMEELELVYPYIDHIHLKDYHYDERYSKPFIHKAIYDGDIDFDGIITYLKEKGYKNALSLEPEVSFEEALICMDRLNEKMA